MWLWQDVALLFPFGIFGFILAIQIKETKSETICGYNMVEVQVQKQYLF